MMSAPAPYPAVHSSMPAPDDHQISTKTPSICVDYLSHNWTDEDVWSSWKAMTKRKNEIANGVRLENASWRTWAKQRGKLKTISPETLNWLKDSDVTWLYGPLHEHADPVPPPKMATMQDKLGLDSGSGAKKSILKHRTISEMLTTPGVTQSPVGEMPLLPSSRPITSDEEVYEEEDKTGKDRQVEAVASPAAPHRRAGFFSVRSDTNLNSRTGSSRKGGSPPASERLLSHPSLDRHGSHASSQSEEKRHISFNQRVDQCIAVDIPEEEGDDEDEDEYSDDDYMRGGRPSMFEDGGSSDEEVLTMRSSPRTSPSLPLTSTSSFGSSRGTSPSSETPTIAKLAPTMLKTSGTLPAPSPAVVDPTGFGNKWAAPRAGAGDDSDEDDETPRTSTQQHGVYHGFDDRDGATRYSQWDADDDINGEFDYLYGPDLSDHYAESDGRHAISDAAEEEDEGSAVVSPPPTVSRVPASSTTPAAAPRSILKRRPIPTAEETAAIEAELRQGSTPESQESLASSGSAGRAHSSSPNAETERVGSPTQGRAERGRPAQRLGSSASYERISDAARSQHGSAYASGRQRTTSNNSTGSSSSPSLGVGSFDVAAGTRSGERRDSFRGRAGEGAKIMDAGAGPSRRGADHGDGDESDGVSSVEFASPGYPASPQLGENRDGHDDAATSEATLYGRKSDPSRWSDDAPSTYGVSTQPAAGSSAASSSRARHGAGSSKHSKYPQPSDADEIAPPEGQRLSVDLENLPSNDPSMGTPLSQVGGPTPLNTPTFALAVSRASGSAGGGAGGSHRPGSSSSGSGGSAGKGTGAGGQTSPTIPKRSAATGALVAPSGPDKDAGVRVPLAHDYVEEDEGGIVGRAVELVNTARDLFGAFWGRDKGQRWREA